ncbi:MAG: cupin domain-containing protein, partial [Actinomycetota bacterium]
MSPRHAVRTAGDAVWGVPPALEGHGRGFRRWTVIDEAAGAIHTGFGLTELDPGGRVDWHVHSFEETVYVLEGEVVLRTSEWALRLVEGDYAMVPIGTPH